MLRPTYTRRPFHILLIGPPASGKRSLAKELLKSRHVFYSMNIAESLPKRNLDRIDYILIFVDMTNTNSLLLMNQLLENISPKYLSTKVIIVVTKVDLTASWAFEYSELDSIVQLFHDLQIFRVNLTNDLQRKLTCEQITRLIKISTLQYENLNSYILKTLDDG
ncbi:unnamed protein product [Rhizopus microsporus]